MSSSPTPSEHVSQRSDSVSGLNHAVYQPPFYYQCAINVLKLLYRLQVWRRSHQRDNYQQEVAQRFGKHYPSPPIAVSDNMTHHGVIWCHAVSLGETNTVAPLLEALLAAGYQIWLTNTTQTGFARGASRFADEIAQGQMSHSYVPVDSPVVIETFLAHVQPIAALFVETELWANILSKLAEQRIPSILVNGRLSASSFASYQKIAAVSRSMMKNLTLIIAQDNESAKRFRQLGASSAQIRVAGSLKWVINAPKQDSSASEPCVDEQSNSLHGSISDQMSLAERFGVAGRPIWVAASTHSGEEEIALSLQQQLLSQAALTDTLLVLVPRHPERFDEVAELVKKSALTMARRSSDEAIEAATQVYVADSMGELMIWYQLANVALVGGSLVDIGGHNPVEPASVATPVIMGRYTQSCQSVVDKLAEVGALYQPYNAFYRPVTTSHAYNPPDTAAPASLTEEACASAAHTAGDIRTETTLIYQQLAAWLCDLALAKRAGLAGERLTRQQQSVLTRQVTMIEEVIAQQSHQEPL
ncbi:3-deoxy-D-manno-octulosonic acid transferase [Psychrobacter celer]